MSNKKFYWIKLKTDFFNLDEIDFLLSQKNGCKYVVLYQMLCLKTANNGGELSTSIGEMIVPFDIDKIVRETKYFDFDTVVLAMELYKKIGLIYEQESGVLKISALKNMVGSETSSAERVRRHRERKALQCNADVTKDLLHCNIEIRDKSLENRDKIIEIDSEKEEKTKRVDYAEIINAYNDTCVSLPSVNKISEARKKAIKARLNSGYSIEDLKRCFEKAENSSFLKGKNGRDWHADFDWLMKDANIAKVLDGKYDDYSNDSGTNQDSNNELQTIDNDGVIGIW